MPSPTDAEFTQTIIGCARCHGDGHEDLVFTKFTHPVERYDVEFDTFEIVATHWAMCPTVNEPIMMTFFEDDILIAAIKEAEAKRGE